MAKERRIARRKGLADGEDDEGKCLSERIEAKNRVKGWTRMMYSQTFKNLHRKWFYKYSFIV